MTVTPTPDGSPPAGLAPRSGAAGARAGGLSAPAPAADPYGLVICAISVRDLETGQVPDDLSGSTDVLWPARFPSADLVRIAADQFVPLPAWAGEEGPRWRVTVSPGAIAVGSKDLAKAARTHDREAGYSDGRKGSDGHHGKMIRSRATFLVSGATYGVDDRELAAWGEVPAGSKRCITAWTAKSRAAMVRALCELDYAPLLGTGLPALVTLTYPGDWLAVAPTGQAVKRQMLALFKRWQRAWGSPFLGVWKLEFQRRGAPHVHLLCVPPLARTADGLVFREWLSAAWAAVVDAPDPAEYARHLAAGTGVDYSEGLRMTDPKRVAVYFTKHGTFSAKEYQNEVPAEWQAPGCGPGRFWGYRGLKRRTAEVELAPSAAVLAARTLRRWSAAQGVTHQCPVRRIDLGTGAVSYRKVRRPVRRVRSGRGWVSVNDGPAFATEVARYLERSTM